MKEGKKSGLSLSSARSLSPSLFLQKKKKKRGRFMESVSSSESFQEEQPLSLKLFISK